MLRRLRHERRFTLEAESGTVRDYIHVDDVVRGLIAFAGDPHGGIVNLARGENISNGEIIDTLNARDFEITLRLQTTNAAGPLCDISRMRGLGMEPMPLYSYLNSIPVPAP